MTVPARSISPSWSVAEPARRPRISEKVIMAGFFVAAGLILLAHQGALLRLGFPLGALAVAVWLFARGPAAYLGFAWWIWFLAPGIRRMADYQSGGWDPNNPISLTPFLVSMLAVVGVLRRLPELRRPRLLPWVVAVICVMYGFFTGVIRAGPMPAAHGLISWLAPLAFGLYCAVEWRRYLDVQAQLQGIFLGGVLILAIYGIVQYFSPPDWDRSWMLNSGMYSLGGAFPYELRVFSLVNAPLPFATLLVAGLLIALSARGVLRFTVLVAATLALMLTLVRSVWLAGLIGLLAYLVYVPVRYSRRIVAGALVTGAALLSIPFLVPTEIGGPTVETVRDRILTLGSIRSDISFQARTSFLDAVSEVVVRNPIGHGLGSTGVSSQLGDAGEGIRDFDNGLFAALYALGWFAGSLLLFATLCMVGLALQRREGPSDYMAKAARAMVVVSVLLLAGSNVFEGVAAAVLWGFAGLVAASHQWHQSDLPRALA